MSNSQETTLSGQSNGPPSSSDTDNSLTAHPQLQHQENNFEILDKASSNTLKRNPKMELSKTDLLQLLSHLEGELQARDIIVATLMSEKVRQLLSSKYKSGTNDPYMALNRDAALSGAQPSGVEHFDQQVATLEALVTRQRRMQARMTKVLKEVELRHRMVIQELEEEKNKNKSDVPQYSDQIESESEKNCLRNELELEKEEKGRLSSELKKANEILDEEKNRNKQIVLVLLADRKKLILEYNEERRKNEELNQLLTESRSTIDQLMQTLEEESKKASMMEAELEKSIAQFDIERQQYKQILTREEKKNQDLQNELEKIKIEIESWKEVQTRGVIRSTTVAPPPPPAKPPNLINMTPIKTSTAAVLGAGTPMISSKVVQPTATVSSVPVSGPTTGIARSVVPGQVLRNVNYSSTGSIEASGSSDPQIISKRTTVGGQIGSSKPALQSQTSVISVLNSGAAKITSTPRGAPPPVPPNKPVVPPKKESTAAAFLRRADSSEVPKFINQQTINTNPVVLQNQPSTIPGEFPDNEGKPR